MIGTMTRKHLTRVLDEAPLFRDPVNGDVAIVLPAEVAGLVLRKPHGAYGVRRPIPGGFLVQFDRAEAHTYAAEAVGDWRRELVAQRLLEPDEYDAIMQRTIERAQRVLVADLA